jgi:hypothetical protein
MACEGYENCWPPHDWAESVDRWFADCAILRFLNYPTPSPALHPTFVRALQRLDGTQFIHGNWLDAMIPMATGDVGAKLYIGEQQHHGERDNSKTRQYRCPSD